MTPDAAKASLARMLAGGDTVLLSRVDVGGIFGPIAARVTGFAADQTVFDLQQGDRKVILPADDVAASGFPLPFAPEQDRIDWNGLLLAVKAVDNATRRVGGALVAYEIQVAGG